MLVSWHVLGQFREDRMQPLPSITRRYALVHTGWDPPLQHLHSSYSAYPVLSDDETSMSALLH